MRNVSIRIAGCFFVLTVLIWSLACKQDVPNNNVAPNQNANTDQGNANVNATLWTSGACDDGVTLQQKRQLVEDDIAKQIRDDGKLKKQLDGEGTQPKRFKFRVVIKDMYLVAYFEGRVDGENQLEDLSEILNNFKKNKCVLKVVLVPAGTLPADPNAPWEPDETTLRSVGFEWGLCEWPKQPCPDGQCHEVCPGPSGGTTLNLSANTNANASGNTNYNRPNANR